MNHEHINRAHTAPRSTLKIEDVHVYYGSAHVIQGVNLDLTDGILSIVGRNGMGKSTLCNAIMGLLPVRSGLISMDGQQIQGKVPHVIANLGIGYVPQGRWLWPSLSVEEHLKLVARNFDHDGAYRIEHIYELFPHLAQRRAHGGGQLSGGEQQMLAIARALLANPQLLVMDEPTEGLAPAIKQKIENVIIDLVTHGRMAILMIEQNIGVATHVSDSIAVMINGRIEHVLPSAELAANRHLQRELLGVKRQKSQ